jgi:hypothetical protein
MKTKRVLRFKRIKMLRGGYVRFDTIPTQGSPVCNGVYISMAAWPGIEKAQEIKVTLDVVK